MTCADARPMLRDFADGELGPAAGEQVAAHLAGCDDCRARAESERQLKGLLRLRVRPASAPPGLAEAIRDRLRSADAARPAGPVRSRAVPRLAAAAALLVVAASAWWALAGRDGATPSPPTRLAAELVDDHIRYLAAAAADEIATSDPAEAERWFAGKLDVAVTLPRFAAGEVPLRGGRLCYVLDRRVALLFYGAPGGPRRRSLFVMAGSGLTLPGDPTREPAAHACASERHKGYTVACWARDGVLYALVSDERGDALQRAATAAYRG